MLADDHPLMLTGLRTALEEDDTFTVVGETSSGAAVLPLVRRLDPDVVLLDLRMPGMDGLACLERIRERHPRTKVVMCSVSADPDVVQSAFRRGACGYIVKSVETRDVAAAIRQAIDGTAFHALGLPAIEADEAVARAAGLSERELEVLKAVARGHPNKVIATEMWITEQTVKFHLSNSYRKLGIANRTEAAHWVLSKGLLADGIA